MCVRPAGSAERRQIAPWEGVRGGFWHLPCSAAHARCSRDDAMWYYAARRIMLAIPIAIGVTIICFCLIYLAPGDPVQNLLPPDASQADVAFLRRAYGLDQPAPVQYAKWLLRALSGDFGKSIQTSRPVLDEVLHALGNTLVISTGAVTLAFPLALFLGTLAAYFVGRAPDRIATGVAVTGISVPNYWFAIVLIIIFAVELHVLPATGMGSAGSTGFNPLQWDQLKY